MAYGLPPYFQLMYFGSGLDGNLTISSNNYTGGPFSNGKLTRDAHFNNLTITGSGQINPYGYKIFVKNQLDISGATGVAIQANGVNGSNASANTGGSGASNTLGGTVGYSLTPSGTGRNGVTGVGTNALSISISGVILGGGLGTVGGGGGASGTPNAGGTGPPNTQTQYWSFSLQNFYWQFSSAYSFSALFGGNSGSGGASGGGDGTNLSGGGGGGAIGAGVIYIGAQILKRSSSNVVGVIQAIGGNGGNGGNAVGGNSGGGGGGSAGAGGFIYIYYGQLTGTTILNGIEVSSGASGSGGNGAGTGLGGRGGQAAQSGRALIFSISNNQRTVITSVGVNAPGIQPTTATGSAGALSSISRTSL